MKLFKLIPLLLLFLTEVTYARTTCPNAKVVNIQIEGNVVLYTQEGSSWRRLGILSEPGTKERYAALLASQMSGRRVTVAYASDTYDCSVSNYAESAYIVRTYSQ